MSVYLLLCPERRMRVPVYRRCDGRPLAASPRDVRRTGANLGFIKDSVDAWLSGSWDHPDYHCGWADIRPRSEPEVCVIPRRLEKLAGAPKVRWRERAPLPTVHAPWAMTANARPRHELN